MGKIVETATLGLVKDPFGTEAAQRSATSATRSAAAAEERMFREGLGFQKEMWDWQKEQAAPWTKAGIGALGSIQEMLSGGYDLTQDPIYQQRLTEQSKAFGASGAAKGMQLSGATLKGLRDITGAELGSAWDRRMAGLGGLMNLGATASTGLSGIGQGYTSGVVNSLGQLGQSQSQMYQNLGAINAQAATAPFQNLMSLGSMFGGVMSGAGAMGMRF